METAFGADREAAVVREITKTFEESVRGTLSELHARFAAAEPRGEIVIVVGGAPVPGDGVGAADAVADADAVTVQALCAVGVSLKDASAAVARLTGTSRRELYQRALARRRELPE